MLLVTTCRKPCTNTRLFARALSNLVPDSEYEPRGKKNIYDLIEAARQKGLRRIAIISDFKGNPGEIEFIKVDGRNWGWADTIIRIKSAKFGREKAKSRAAAVEGKLKKKLSDLLDITDSEEPDIVITAEEDKISFGDKINIKVEVYKNSEE